MQKEDKVCNITPANRVGSVQEYYFSKKLKEVAEMNAAGKNVINLGVGSPDLPPSEQTIETLCEHAHNANEHGYQPALSVFDGTRGHNSRHITTESHYQRNERFTMESHFVHDLIHNESSTCHIT